MVKETISVTFGEMTDEEFYVELKEVVRLLDGLESATHHCACKRLYRLGIAPELGARLMKVRAELCRRMNTEPGEHLPDTGRFGLIEVD